MQGRTAFLSHPQDLSPLHVRNSLAQSDIERDAITRLVVHPAPPHGPASRPRQERVGPGEQGSLRSSALCCRGILKKMLKHFYYVCISGNQDYWVANHPKKSTP